MGEIELGYSFDDVLLVPQKSGIVPSEADTRSRLTARIPLNIPIISSAMDTVSEDVLAIALAREGGIGVIHRNCTIEKQAEMVARVKRSENMIISDPFTVTADMTIRDLQSVMELRGVNGFPVIDSDGRLRGMVTTRDIWYIEDANTTTVGEVMTPRERLVTSIADTSLEDARAILYKNRIEKLPLVDENDRLAGLITSQDIEKRQQFTDAAKDEQGRLRVGAAVGSGEQALDRARALIQAGTNALFIDAATGHTGRVVKLIGQLRELSDEVDVIAGNVVTQEGARDLIDAGAAAIKVGVGPGSICTTRVISGVGVPQFSAIQNVAAEARPRGIPVIADGGIRYSGDIVKALAAGADSVMLGSLLAGTREAPGAMVQHQGRTFKEYRGMGSLKAMRAGSGDRYGQNSSGKLVAEGVEARVPYRGRLNDVIFQLLGGLRSGMGYVGAQTLDKLRTDPKFVRITTGGLRESHPHDITITQEPDNYQSAEV
jgi:IMP dehydrogenase